MGVSECDFGKFMKKVMARQTFLKGIPMDSLKQFMSGIIEYDTPKVVTVHKPSIGLLRRALQLAVILFVGLYQLWYAQGYQEVAGIESSVTTKVKGYSQSSLGDVKVPQDVRQMYERVWDEADYVVPPAENGAFFVTTNVVITPNQTWGECPEDPGEVRGAQCRVEDSKTKTSSSCIKGVNVRKSHGPQTGRCVPNNNPKRFGNVTVCEIQSWCPVEDDRLVLGRSRPLITGSENHTVFIKNSIRFSYFGDHFHRNNLPIGEKICFYDFSKEETWLCNIFRLGDIVEAAGGNYTTLSITGGVVAIHIKWICNLDFDFETNCLPKYHFRLLDTMGWNFRHAHFHEEGRRTLYKAFGIKFVIIVQGRASKFDLKNTVINVVAGLGLLSFITMFCDFILLNYVSERMLVKQKKFEVLDKQDIMTGLLNVLAATNTTNYQLPKTTTTEDGKVWISEWKSSEHLDNETSQMSSVKDTSETSDVRRKLIREDTKMPKPKKGHCFVKDKKVPVVRDTKAACAVRDKYKFRDNFACNGSASREISPTANGHLRQNGIVQSETFEVMRNNGSHGEARRRQNGCNDYNFQIISQV